MIKGQRRKATYKVLVLQYQRGQPEETVGSPSGAKPAVFLMLTSTSPSPSSSACWHPQVAPDLSLIHI
ncbi:hypothetical protein T4E_7469 [Trichinella pseudospiralis]|uniref:Uncharacterized protein n=1 Tax=Trichinella pseudospiralis TaxID=6337 RepID=A0A0V0WL47_TRIPS|nr:hypothetical protein T4E_7469 [Trichinella pseudospiralis]